MTERKPPGMTFESWVERQIREAQSRGEFDNLPGAGRPLPGAGEVDEENWWLTSYLRREGVSTEELLPPALRLRKEIDRLPETVRGLRSESDVRDVVAKLNARIRDRWRSPAPPGPQPHVPLVNAEAVVQRWRADRSTAAEGAAAPTERATTADPPARRVPWRRRLGHGRDRRGPTGSP